MNEASTISNMPLPDETAGSEQTVTVDRVPKVRIGQDSTSTENNVRNVCHRQCFYVKQVLLCNFVVLDC